VSVKARIEEKLLAALQPEHLEVVDESHLHAGHAGHRPEGETHFRVYIMAPAFVGKSRVERHRLVNQALAEELAGPVDPALTEAGQSILVERRPRGEKIIANAYQRSLAVDSALDPRLREFAEYWLGRSALR
jgi:BolA protein